ncbi:DNA cytosine methyltransferase [Hymenobacter rubripertinctus]|nr:DNA cytosine methyltransferase [Hymenobacter rubripertinctus]
MEGPDKPYSSIDLFAGAGGLSIGLHQAGISSLYAVEYDKHAAKTFALKFPDATVSCADVRTIDFSKYRGKVDVVCGGPPCQPFSSGGLRNAAEDARDMIPTFVEAVRVVAPRAFLMENVNGLTVGDRRLYLDSVLAKLEDLGYTITWRVVNAADYGVPQIRKRLIVIGVREGTFTFPEPTHGPHRDFAYVSSGEVLSTVVSQTKNTAKITYARNPSLRPNPYHGQLYNGGGRPLDLEQPAPTLLASAGGNKTHFIADADSITAYHGHLSRGGGPQTGDLPGARRLTIEESAALQTFPLDMQFSGPQSSQYRQIGNAVPPHLAYVIGEQLVIHLREHPENATQQEQQLNQLKFSQLMPANIQLGLFSEKTITYMAQKEESTIWQSVQALTETIDRFTNSENGLKPAEIPSAKYREAVIKLLKGRKSNSVKTGCLFLVFYKVIAPEYDFTSLPTGYRGKNGDKLLGAELKHRHITLGQVTAWGENIGAKGDQPNFNLRTDSRFGEFITIISQANQDEVTRTALLMASMFADSRVLPVVLPALSADALSFVRAKMLFKALVETQVGGSIQQFLVAALLRALRSKQNIRVETHNFNAADKSDGTAGDIEEFIDENIIRAYEVTMRPDWKSRLPDFREKMDRAGLHKYVIIAASVNSDDDLREPAAMALTLGPVQRDIAVIDIMDFLSWMAAELSAKEIQIALKDVNAMLQNPKLGAKQAHIDIYLEVVGKWLDSVAE